MEPAGPLLALTTGDPAGIGPEISLRAAAGTDLLLVGDACVLESAARAGQRVRLLPCTLTELAAGHRPAPAQETVHYLDTGTLAAPVPLGIASAEGGRAAFAAIELAIEGARRGVLAGVVTAPVNKLAFSMAGITFPGHTEIFADRTGTRRFAMLMYSRKVAVGLATCHQPLRSVPESLTVERLVEVGELLDSSVARLRGGARPRIAVLGLNPHAGESGLFGDEEQRIVQPAVERLRQAGIAAQGPLPPDTAFTPAALEAFQAHLCLYHDQGLIPFKALAFDTGVNITMGIPFVRTSVDHGTAYDIAGRGVADDSSLREAIAAARALALAHPA